MTAGLVIVGAALQLAGIFALAWPDARPFMRRLNAWLGRHFRRFLARRPKHHTVTLGTAMSAEAAIRISGVTALREDADPAEAVEWLLKRDREAQEAENRLAGRLADLEAAHVKDLEAARNAMEAQVDARIEGERLAYRPLRVVGAVLLVAGVACSTVGALLQ